MDGCDSLWSSPVLTGSITTGEAQTGLYIQMDMGLSVAPPRIAEGSDND